MFTSRFLRKAPEGFLSLEQIHEVKAGRRGFLGQAMASAVAAMAAAGTIAVMLPGAYYTLRETRLPPIEALLRHRVPMAVSTDLNPGTSALRSLRLAMGMACTLFRLTPDEALRGATAGAADALGMGDRVGRLRPEARADLVV